MQAATTNPAQMREEFRLETLQRSGLLDSAPEDFFDRLTKLATEVLGVPVALISLIDRDRQFFKSQAGLPEPLASTRETPLSHSFCQYVVVSGQPLVVNDAREIPLVRDNLAVRDFNVAAYAGIPLQAANGDTLGSFCALDMKPREWSLRDIELLCGFADQAMIEINLRLEIGELRTDLTSSRALHDERALLVRQNIHDLRTPTTAVLLGLDAVEQAGPLNPTQQKFLDLARTNANALGALINELLQSSMASAASAAAFPLEKCSTTQLLQRALEQVEPLAERAQIPIHEEAIADVVLHQVDARELVRVLVNLLTNAIKFTPRGRNVFITVEEIPQTAAVRFSVSDEGIGIAAQDIPLLFRDGSRLNRHASLDFSSGIGLAYCKRVVEAHGGSIEVRSELGVGSSFSFVIPRAGKPPALES
ncbi:MAG TPA: GAF domain-containing sensor histidine kinase [Chthoniobacterales bacterium]|nr:GAF domain-containing sensor histidine kinase [Chthoniobacterales bacterium]